MLRAMNVVGWLVMTVWSTARPALAQVEPLTLPSSIAVPANVDLAGSFTVRVCVRLDETPADLPTLVANKEWASGEVRDYTTNNAFGVGRESGVLRGFAISVLPDGAWTWNAGDGAARIDHRPEAADQGIADGRWHEVGFSIDRDGGVAHLYHDGRRVALHDLQGVGSVDSESGEIQLVGGVAGLSLGAVQLDAGVRSEAEVEEAFVARFGEARRPAASPTWDGAPLRVLAWNIWHGGRRKGREEGVQRVVEVIEDSGADIVLMQETYGSGPIISGRLGFDYVLRSSNLSIMSRYPIDEVHRLYQGFRFGGATIRLRPDVAIQAYSLWIHHLPSVGKQLADGASPQELVAAEGETRGKEARQMLDALLPHLARTPSMPVLVGGDFNSGSHLDWTPAAADLPNHHGRVVPWPVSTVMEEAGFVDTYRTAHPDPVQEPGRTWSPEFPESHQDRIDYVYARGDSWRVLDSEVLSTHPQGWPSDHAAVLSTLELEPAPTRIKVMSYNIKHGRGNDGVVDLERAAAVIEAVDPDVVTLQEVDEQCARSGGVDQAKWLGERLGMTPVFGPFMDYDGGRYGMAMLSRLPITTSSNLVLPPGVEPRSALAARVVLADGREAIVVGIHLYATEDQRLAQARAVIDEFGDESVPVILAGDFNSTPKSPVMALFDEGWTCPDKGTDHWTFPSDAPRTEIDYFVYRSPGDARVLALDVVDEPVVSDHRPLWFTLELSR